MHGGGDGARLQGPGGSREGYPRDTFDPKAIVEKVGNDPAKLFEWVRDNTYWVPYRGSLRGPIGVLMDRLGNSLDRALLLAELLRTAGHQARLVCAELSEAQAKELLLKLRPVPEHPLLETPPASQDELNKLIEKYAKQYQLDAAVLRKASEKNAFRAAKLAEESLSASPNTYPQWPRLSAHPREKTPKRAVCAKRPTSWRRCAITGGCNAWKTAGGLNWICCCPMPGRARG